MLCFLDKALPAGGTGDTDFSLSSGDSNPSIAGGTYVITIGSSAAKPGKELAKLFVFLIASGSIPGKDAENRQQQRNISKTREQHDVAETAHQIQHDS